MARLPAAGRIALLALLAVRPGAAAAPPAPETRYLAFQVFTASPDLHAGFGGTPVLGAPPGAASLDAFARDLVARIGTTGSAARRLAVVFGPIAFDHSDAHVRTLIAAAFDIALRRNIAVGFHIDDAMFWSRRRDLRGDPRYIERAGWTGGLSTGRRLDWGPRPSRAPPQLCLNSAGVEAAVRQRGRVVGAAVRAGLDRLHRARRDDLFAGVIVGWETQIGRDFDSGRMLGYCAAANRGLRPGATAAALDAARVAAVEHFIALWSAAVAAGGVPPTRLYAHVAFVPRRSFAPDAADPRSYLQRTNFSPASVAFGAGRRAGFSTYPEPGQLEDILAERRGGGAPWASAEGANVALGGDPTASGMSAETYLARLFDGGATLVNIFGWGVGPPANGFRRAAEDRLAIAAYAHFLGGGALVAGPVVATAQQRLMSKLRRIQAGLPAWVRRHDGASRAQPLVATLQAALAAHDLRRAERAADALLALIAGA